MYKLYIIRSLKTKKYYIGISADLEQRLRHHNSGANKSTRNAKPWTIVYTEEFNDKKSAWLRERQIKKYKSGEAFKKLINRGEVA
ncbi:MAG: GIY-YIG nuclease family protein [Patescibacteria group bacterium]